MKSAVTRRLSTAICAGVLAIAGATTWSSLGRAAVVDNTYDLTLDGTLGSCAGTICPISLGTVTVTGDTDSILTYTVDFGSAEFHGGSMILYFELTDGSSGPPITFSVLTPGGIAYSFIAPASGSYVPDSVNFPGPYNYSLGCSLGINEDDLCGEVTFTASGATSENPFVIGNPLGGGPFAGIGVGFVGDLTVGLGVPGVCTVGNSACIGFVGAELSSSAVPEPTTWAMMLLGFAGLGFVGYRRTRKPISIEV